MSCSSVFLGGMYMQTFNDSTAVIYARFSSNNQREESIEAQLRLCKSYAQQKGLHVVDTYCDYAKSATTADRDEFQSMIKDSKKKKFKYVIVHKLDRFSRDRYDSVMYKRQLLNNNVQLLSVTENIDGSPESMMLESVLEDMASYYSKNLAREVQKGQIQSALKCRHLGGHTPLGYNINKETKLYEINEVEAETIKTIYSKYLEGYGYMQLLEYLNNNGYRTKQNKLFTKSSLNYILTSPKYKGTYVFNRFKDKKPNGKRSPTLKDESEIITIENGMPAIVDADTFDKVQLKLEKEKGKQGKYRAKRDYLLSGLIYCSCGYAYTGNYRKNGKGKKDYTSYRCSGRLQKMSCNNKEIRKEYIEGYGIEQLKEKVFNNKSIDELTRRLDVYNEERLVVINTETTRLQEELDNVNGKIGDIVNLVTTSSISISTVSKQIRELEVLKIDLESLIKEQLNEKAVLVHRQKEIADIAFLTSEVMKQGEMINVEKLVSSYVDKVIVHEDIVEVRFKISVVEDNQFKPLIVKEYKDVIFEKYKIINR